MNILSIGLLIIIPYILYIIIIKMIENRTGIEMDKGLKYLIFTMVDIVIFLIFNALGLS